MTHFTKTLRALCVLLSISHGAMASDGLTEGPGLFSAETGELNIKSLLKQLPANNTNATAPTHDQHEFELFKQWQAAKEGNTERYQEFKRWLEYQAFIGS